MENSGKVVSALLVGTAIGAVLGVLFAPDKGSETRKKIAEGAKGLSDDLQAKVRDTMSTFRDSAEDLVDAAGNKINDFKNEAKSKMDHYQSSASNSNTANKAKTI